MNVSLQLHKRSNCSLDLVKQIFKLKDSTYFGIKHYKSEHMQLKIHFSTWFEPLNSYVWVTSVFIQFLWTESNKLI